MYTCVSTASQSKLTFIRLRGSNLASQETGLKWWCECIQVSYKTFGKSLCWWKGGLYTYWIEHFHHMITTPYTSDMITTPYTRINCHFGVLWMTLVAEWNICRSPKWALMGKKLYTATKMFLDRKVNACSHKMFKTTRNVHNSPQGHWTTEKWMHAL